MPDWRNSLQKVTALIYLSFFISSWQWRELGLLPRPRQWQLQMGIPSRLPAALSTQQIRPRQAYASLRGSHSATPTKHLPKSLLCCLTKPLPFPPSNLASFVNISWAACMHSCTKIFLTIETVITLLHCMLHKVILFFFLPIFPKGECINGKEKNSCLQTATRTRKWCVNHQHS